MGKDEGEANKGDSAVGVHYRRPDEEEEVNEAFYRQLEAASRSQALALMEDFSLPGICWKGSTAGLTPARRFLQSTDENFLTQEVEKPSRHSVLLDLALTNKGRAGDVKAEGNLGSVTTRWENSGSCVEEAGQ